MSWSHLRVALCFFGGMIFLVIFAPVLSITYQERLRVMARRRLDNLSWFYQEKVPIPTPETGTDKSDSKLYYNASAQNIISSSEFIG